MRPIRDPNEDDNDGGPDDLPNGDRPAQPPK